jgi:type I restriction enzyme S subunit
MRGRVSLVVNSNYLRLVLRSTLCKTAIDELIVTTAGQNTISQGSLNSIAFPLPPLAEQRRVVAAIESAFAVIDAIEQNKFVLQDVVATAKSKILSLAIRGKLVPQDPNDEPASILLERIRSEREKLVKKGKIKRGKNESAVFRGDDNSYYEKIGGKDICIDEKIPFDAPNGWIWARLGDVTNIVLGQSPTGDSVTGNPTGIEFHQGKIFFTDRLLAHSGQYTSENNKIADKDSVLLCVRAPVGIANITSRTIAIGRGLCALSPLGNISVEFLFHWLTALQSSFIEQATGTTFIAITADVVRQQFVPIPPFIEQRRIIETVENGLSYLKGIAESLN